MTLDDYQEAALRTVAKPVVREFRRMILALGIAGEAGEVADEVKKEIGHGHPEDRARIAYEPGDVLWYVTCLADEYDWSLSEVAAMNLAKLRKRYPEGFSSEASVRRDG